MTLIIKELIIRGVVTSDICTTGELSPEVEAIQKALEEIKKEIKEECLEMITR
ncbi:MAG: DUF5908 family protein [Eudoraea sp.]|uniref:DUF5908 family protein n=1 Tax=Eudoraea sp. TaxID=1979955 RepID=UPI003C77EDF8